MTKKSKLAIGICGVVLAALVIWRIYYINTKYPQAEVVAYNMLDEFEFNELEFTVTDYQIFDADQVIDGFVSEVTDSDGNPLSNDQCKFLVVEMTIVNHTGKEITVPLYSLLAESGGWANGISSNAFKSLNESLEQPTVKLLSGKSCEVNVPFAMYSTQFKDKDWNKIDQREYKIVFSTYPVKTVVELAD